MQKCGVAQKLHSDVNIILNLRENIEKVIMKTCKNIVKVVAKM